MGDGNETESYVPVPVPGLSNVKAIAAGGDDSFALLENGTVMAWGDNDSEQLGDGETWKQRHTSETPVAVCAAGEAAPCAHDLGGVKEIAAGINHALALLENGTVLAWGSNSDGALGQGKTTGELEGSSVPVAVSGLSNVKAIACGSFFSLALLENGTVVGWGENDSGALGDGSSTSFDEGADSPVAMTGSAMPSRSRAGTTTASFCLPTVP